MPQTDGRANRQTEGRTGRETDGKRNGQREKRTERGTDRGTGRPGLVVQFDWVLGRLQVEVGCCMQIASNCIFPVCPSVRTDTNLQADERTDGSRRGKRVNILCFILSFGRGQSELWLITKETRLAATAAT